MIVLITDPRRSDAQLGEIVSAACRAIPAGKFAILLRDKARDAYGVLDLAQRLEKIVHEHGHLFFMTRKHLRVAWEIAVDGVHMSEEKPSATARAKLLPGPRVLTSMPAHTDDDVQHAAQNEVDWALVSPIFATPDKGEPRGLDAIRFAAKIKGNQGRLKIIALGGIDASNAATCLRAGADGVAIIRAILDAPDPFAAASALWGAVESAVVASSLE